MSQVTTKTTTAKTALHLTADGRLPQNLGNKFKNYAKLSRAQAGHLRHFHNLASQADGEWALMGHQDPGQEWETSYRYQLAIMAYAAGAAHYHRLPAMRGMFRSLLGRLIHKMLRREVWSYWYLTSQGGIMGDPDLKELRKPWADPVVRENIMYSGHLLLMVSLYSMLFGDNSFDEPDAIVFNWDPMFWGFGPEKFSYTRSSLQDAILKEMELGKWLGVCCEPNMIFVVCNQFPMIAMRYNDAVKGTKVADEVVPKFRAAWEKKGLLSKNSGLLKLLYMVKQDLAVDVEEIPHSAWAMAFMPWNYDTVKTMYPAGSVGFFQRLPDRININPPHIASAIRRLVKDEQADPDSPSTLQRARETPAQDHGGGFKPRFINPMFGFIGMWVSEVAGGPDVDKYLRHADTYMRPTWSNGGLYYKRNDEGWDEDGNFVFVDPVSGNGALGYARLNVKDGQKKMWDHPWTPKEVHSRPWVDNVGLEDDVDTLRGIWSEEDQALVATFRTWNGDTRTIRPVVKALPAGRYGVYVDGELKQIKELEKGGDIEILLEIGENEADLVVLGG